MASTRSEKLGMAASGAVGHGHHCTRRAAEGVWVRAWPRGRVQGLGFFVFFAGPFPTAKFVAETPYREEQGVGFRV